MGLETSTYISGLVTTNPLETDLMSAGEDHIKLLKRVLKNTFPTADTALRIKNNEWKNITSGSSYQVVAADEGKTIYVSSNQNFTVNLPASPADGFTLTIVNASSHTVSIVPASGNSIVVQV